MKFDHYLDQTTAVAEQLLSEIAARYPGQARNHAGNRQMAEAWGRAIAESGIDIRSLPWALAQLTTRPYPPDVGALLHQARQHRLPDEKVARQWLRKVRACCANGLWHELPSDVWQAASSIGPARIRDCHDEPLLPEWRIALRHARDEPDHECRARQPKKQPLRLTRASGRTRQGSAIVDREIAEIVSRLGLTSAA